MRRDAKANRDTDVAESGVDTFSGALAREVLLERGLVAPCCKAEADGDHQHTVDQKKPSRDLTKTNEQHEEPHWDDDRGTLSDDLHRGNDMTKLGLATLGIWVRSFVLRIVPKRSYALFVEHQPAKASSAPQAPPMSDTCRLRTLASRWLGQV